MNMIPTATPYTMGLDTAYFYNPSYNPLNGMYPAYHDYSKSDSNSDESLNDGKSEHHKLSPKYREKRAKNNEAAKKSRLNRRAREKNLQHDNTRLTNENTQLKAQNQEKDEELALLRRQLEEAAAAYNQLQQQHFGDQMMTNCMDVNHMILRDSSNQQIPQQQQPPQMMAPNSMAFDFKPL